MKKKLFLILMSSFCAFKLSAQSLVLDPAVLTTLWTTHSEQQKTLDDIKTEETNIRNWLLLIQNKMDQINELQEKTYNYLSTVNAVVKNGKDIIYASTIAQDIAKYQAQAMDYAANDPKLLVIAAKSEYELISRSADLFIYIYNIALQGGDSNLLDNKQRIDLCTHVVRELRTMRCLAYSVCRQMKTATRQGVLKTLNPGQFTYINNSKNTVDKIIKDLKYISKGGKY